MDRKHTSKQTMGPCNAKMCRVQLGMGEHFWGLFWGLQLQGNRCSDLFQQFQLSTRLHFANLNMHCLQSSPLRLSCRRSIACPAFSRIFRPHLSNNRHEASASSSIEKRTRLTSYPFELHKFFGCPFSVRNVGTVQHNKRWKLPTLTDSNREIAPRTSCFIPLKML